MHIICTVTGLRSAHDIVKSLWAGPPMIPLQKEFGSLWHKSLYQTNSPAKRTQLFNPNSKNYIIATTVDEMNQKCIVQSQEQ